MGCFHLPRTFGFDRKVVIFISEFKFSIKRPDYKTKYAKKTVSGNVIEFLEMNSKPSAPLIQKLSADQYYNILTGEVCNFKKSDSRADNTDSLRKTFKKIRDLVNANTTDNSNIHWVTLTYAENMTDTVRLRSDFDCFWKRFKRFCIKNNLSCPEYISVIEPQARGAWHIHCIIVWKHKRPYIDNNSDFAPLWSHGFTKIQGVPDDCDNLGAYLSAYLSDMALADSDSSDKKYIKGARLKLYPVGVNIYRHSRGIKKPDSKQLCLDEIEKEKASSGKLTFSSSVTIIDDEGHERHISKSYYNKKR